MNVLTIATGANSEPQPSGLTLPVMALALARDFRRSDVKRKSDDQLQVRNDHHVVQAHENQIDSIKGKPKL